MIDLPDRPRPAAADVTLLDFGALLTPGLGGPVQRVNRMGSRFQISVSMPPMKIAQARQWQADLIRGQSEGVRMRYPLLGFNPGAPGAFVVNGSGQSGTTLSVRGGTPNYVFRKGQPFSIVTGGKHHLYLVAAETIADNSGNANVPVTPMLRRPHLDGDVCNFGKPMIEGFITTDALTMAMSIGQFMGLAFEIAESQ